MEWTGESARERRRAGMEYGTVTAVEPGNRNFARGPGDGNARIEYGRGTGEDRADGRERQASAALHFRGKRPMPAGAAGPAGLAGRQVRDLVRDTQLLRQQHEERER